MKIHLTRDPETKMLNGYFNDERIENVTYNVSHGLLAMVGSRSSMFDGDPDRLIKITTTKFELVVMEEMEHGKGK